MALQCLVLAACNKNIEKNKAKLIFWVLRPLLTIVQKVVKLLQMATKSLRFLCFRGFLGEPSTYLPPPTSPKNHWRL